MAIKGSAGSTTFLCGQCRDILAKSIDPDFALLWEYHEDAADTDDEFTPLCKVRDAVFKCKGGGSFNEMAGPE